MANVLIARRWLMDSAAFGELKWSSRSRGGSEAASWRSDSMKRLPYRPGQRVDIVEMGVPVFSGTLLEPDGDTFYARGLYYQGIRARALTGGGAATGIPDTAVTQGIARGVLNWTLPTSLSATSVGDVSAPQPVNEILDLWAKNSGQLWRVTARGAVEGRAVPTTPRWYVTPGSGQLTMAEDSYVSTLYGRYLDSGTGLYATVSHTDTAAASRFGPREDIVDMTKDGTLSMTAARALSIVTNTLIMGKSRPGWANSLRLASWELTTAGDAPANLRAVRGGDLIRVLGQMDMTIKTGPKPYVDFVAEEVSYEDGSDFIDIKPQGLEARALEDVLALALN